MSTPERNWYVRGTRSGRGVFAARNIEAGEIISVTRPLMSVLEEPHCKRMCARCHADSPAGLCTTCQLFCVCAACDKEFSGLRTWHGHECRAFMSIDEPVRDGATEQLRFLLRYYTVAEHGIPEGYSKEGNSVAEIQMLRKMRDEQLEQFLDGAATYTEVFCRHFPLPVPFIDNDVFDLLCRIKTNSFPFPFHSVDGKEASLGFTLNGWAALVNHGCRPNVHLPADKGGLMTMVALHPISKDAELLISYVDPSQHGQDDRGRARHLLNVHRFTCACPSCRPAENAFLDASETSVSDAGDAEASA